MRDECEHGSLRRSCALCEKDATIAALRELSRVLGEALAPLGVRRYFCTKCCGHIPDHFIHDRAICGCGYCMTHIEPRPEYASARARYEAAKNEGIL